MGEAIGREVVHGAVMGRAGGAIGRPVGAVTAEWP